MKTARWMGDRAQGAVAGAGVTRSEYYLRTTIYINPSKFKIKFNLAFLSKPVQ